MSDAERILRDRINTKPKDDRYQVRFWTTRYQYSRFTEECDKNRVDYAHAFNEFMCWYVGPYASQERSLARMNQMQELNRRVREMGLNAPTTEGKTK